MVGAVMMARALPDEASQRACLDAAKQMLRQMATTLTAAQAPQQKPKAKSKSKAL